MRCKKDSKKVVESLKDYCIEKKMRYTPSRYIVLEIIAASERPIGAYSIIDEMGKVTDKPKPTTVYRAIDFLQENGFIHKIESLNAFVACEAGHVHFGSQFIVCTDCGAVEEVHLCNLPEDLRKKVEATGFKMDHWNTEIHGLCETCQT